MTEHDFPTVSYHEVYHVGDLNAERVKPRFSHEGKALSVSQHPDAWRQIASGVGGTNYCLIHPDTPVFYDCEPGGPPRGYVLKACADAGFFDLVSGVKVSWDEEDPSRGGPNKEPPVVTKSVRTATQEAAEERVPLHAENPRFEDVEVPVIAARGESYWRDAFSSDPSAASVGDLQLLSRVWFAEIHDLMGFWNHTEYAPYDYSAPCGAIRQSRLNEWTITPTPTSD
ncbi:hypothetical protein [Salinibaculum rarum]|uniref:hypothetical protein n=1 Tax=Salinibaculum rarum TaxID=3058903 RepID=UPI00265FB655|nr:hypothetical protein [Salinibaculum sp. KK48]